MDLLFFFFFFLWTIQPVHACWKRADIWWSWLCPADGMGARTCLPSEPLSARRADNSRATTHLWMPDLEPASACSCTWYGPHLVDLAALESSCRSNPRTWEGNKYSQPFPADHPPAHHRDLIGWEWISNFGRSEVRKRKDRDPHPKQWPGCSESLGVEVPYVPAMWVKVCVQYIVCTE